MLELRHLRYFIAVGQELNFHKAADRLQISQPALWRQMQDLEADLGVQLLVRGRRGLALTGAGDVLLAEAIRIVEQVNEARGLVLRFAQGRAGILRIAFNEIAARNGKLPLFFREYRLRYPDIELQLTMLMSEQQFAALERGEIDAGFLFNHARSGMTLNAVNIAQDDHVLAVPRQHPLAVAPLLHLRDLAGEKLIFPTQANNRIHHARLMAACYEGGLLPLVVQRTDNEETLLNMVSTGMGLALVNASCAERAYDEVVLRRIEDLSIPVSLDLAWREDRANPALTRFVELVGELADPERLPQAPRVA